MTIHQESDRARELSRRGSNSSISHQNAAWRDTSNSAEVYSRLFQSSMSSESRRQELIRTLDMAQLMSGEVTFQPQILDKSKALDQNASRDHLLAERKARQTLASKSRSTKKFATHQEEKPWVNFQGTVDRRQKLYQSHALYRSRINQVKDSYAAKSGLSTCSFLPAVNQGWTPDKLLHRPPPRPEIPSRLQAERDILIASKSKDRIPSPGDLEDEDDISMARRIKRHDSWVPPSPSTSPLRPSERPIVEWGSVRKAAGFEHHKLKQDNPEQTNKVPPSLHIEMELLNQRRNEILARNFWRQVHDVKEDLAGDHTFDAAKDMASKAEKANVKEENDTEVFEMDGKERRRRERQARKEERRLFAQLEGLFRSMTMLDALSRQRFVKQWTEAERDLWELSTQHRQLRKAAFVNDKSFVISCAEQQLVRRPGSIETEQQRYEALGRVHHHQHRQRSQLGKVLGDQMKECIAAQRSIGGIANRSCEDSIEVLAWLATKWKDLPKQQWSSSLSDSIVLGMFDKFSKADSDARRKALIMYLDTCGLREELPLDWQTEIDEVMQSATMDNEMAGLLTRPNSATSTASGGIDVRLLASGATSPSRGQPGSPSRLSSLFGGNSPHSGNASPVFNPASESGIGTPTGQNQGKPKNNSEKELSKLKVGFQESSDNLVKSWENVIKKEKAVSKSTYSNTMQIHSFMDADSKLEGAEDALAGKSSPDGSHSQRKISLGGRSKNTADSQPSKRDRFIPDETLDVFVLQLRSTRVQLKQTISRLKKRQADIQSAIGHTEELIQAFKEDEVSETDREELASHHHHQTEETQDQEILDTKQASTDQHSGDRPSQMMGRIAEPSSNASKGQPTLVHASAEMDSEIAGLEESSNTSPVLSHSPAGSSLHASNSPFRSRSTDSVQSNSSPKEIGGVEESDAETEHEDGEESADSVSPLNDLVGSRSRSVSIAHRLGLSERDPGWTDRMQELDQRLDPVESFGQNEVQNWRKSSVILDKLPSTLTAAEANDGALNAAVAIMKRNQRSGNGGSKASPSASSLKISVPASHALDQHGLAGPATVGMAGNLSPLRREESPVRRGLMSRQLTDLRRKYGIESFLPVPINGQTGSPLTASLGAPTSQSEAKESDSSSLEAALDSNVDSLESSTDMLKAHSDHELLHPQMLVNLPSLATPREDIILSALGDAARRRKDQQDKEVADRLTQGMFKKFDKEGKGSLSFEELGDLLTGLGHSMDPQTLKRAFQAMDVNGDGLIEVTEFTTWWNKISYHDPVTAFNATASVTSIDDATLNTSRSL